MNKNVVFNCLSSEVLTRHNWSKYSRWYPGVSVIM